MARRAPGWKDKPLATMRVRCSRHIHRVVLMESGAIALPDHPKELREAELAAACLGESKLRCFHILETFQRVTGGRWRPSRRRRSRWGAAKEPNLNDPRRVLSKELLRFGSEVRALHANRERQREQDSSDRTPYEYGCSWDDPCDCTVPNAKQSMKLAKMTVQDRAKTLVAQRIAKLYYEAFHDQFGDNQRVTVRCAHLHIAESGAGASSLRSRYGFAVPDVWRSTIHAPLDWYHRVRGKFPPFIDGKFLLDAAPDEQKSGLYRALLLTQEQQSIAGRYAVKAWPVGLRKIGGEWQPTYLETDKTFSFTGYEQVKFLLGQNLAM